MKLKRLLNRIPRPVRAGFYTICVLVLAVCYYVALDCPTLTFRQEFRRAEKINLVGPSTIVDTLNDKYDEYDKMIVGETPCGICFFGRYYDSYPYDDSSEKKRYHFSYIEKTGDITIAAAPNVWGMFWEFHGFKQSLPVYLFVEEPNAVRAEIVVTVSGTYDQFAGQTVEVGYKRTFKAEATRIRSGVFRFWFTANDTAGLAALRSFSGATGGNPNDARDEYLTAAYPTTVRLYDKNDNLILERELIIGNTAK